ncbi:MAG: fructose 1,6-bisphosphatase [Bacteroidetes bacterium GWE2_39_28]|nr:MAG: fructose 1,6-bisphosphatase [Bacteroidetes bacterium GWE2_39_28]OFY13503.1 MAG: fructose 1,6-bisphosphatase [Bacteroidetes bacterium GWF2_39_10]OFZ07186.1 MAG: fructose 1,6-bisphosphatase [Bacteroidetes bacterium RIFOXYB2_FULL_39_7]OFZ11664.1 MAG: fructose 1,6-bisphosphatase [Bacteroidetes bacterium RIFOXYC2_FULL_39_11]HCT94835.1 class 3 fructose-bisphosphatase [Rikenellaceae bacterium]
MKDLKYLRLLAKSFPTISDATTEIINLEAILNLPKGTEHFLTDIHAEHEAFSHVLKNASGVIRKKVEMIFGHSLRESEKRELCTLIYYPKEKLKIIQEREGKEIDEWYKIVLVRLMRVCGNVSSKYTRSKVRKALPKEYSYIIQELLHESLAEPNKQEYIAAIISTIVSTGRAKHFIIAICNVIQQLTIDSLHIIGDIYDRGPGAHIIMDLLCNYHNFDIQWGNHDLVWMGAASGSEACMANVIRISLRYANLATLEEGYGINLMPLATFAMETYGDDPCTLFKPKANQDEPVKSKHIKMISQMHKAISVIQFKLEGAVIARNKDFEMDDRRLLHLIDFKKGTITLEGVEYALKDTNFPTIDPADPYKLTEEEHDLVGSLMHYFLTSEKLYKHMRCIYNHGSVYLVRNSNLLYHGSMPLNEDGTLKSICISGEEYAGKALFDKFDKMVRQAFFEERGKPNKHTAKDMIWYLWCGPYSPQFDKEKMATFERYFIAEKETHKEKKGYYYYLKDNKQICEMILKEFGIEDSQSHIINGHIPVKTGKGESPIKAGGKLLVIDGGYSKAYQPETGIAGYTLIYNSHGLLLIQHQPFVSTQKAIEDGDDIISETTVVEFSNKRRLVRDTDIGAELQKQIDDLMNLVSAYRNGVIKET